VILALSFLKLNGLELRADPDDLADIVLAIAARGEDPASELDALDEWIVPRLEPRAT
jgi:prophage maintenance system killer protein